jgi:hypothetical protein
VRHARRQAGRLIASAHPAVVSKQNQGLGQVDLARTAALQ